MHQWFAFLPAWNEIKFVYVLRIVYQIYASFHDYFQHPESEKKSCKKRAFHATSEPQESKTIGINF
jgi:hypothetical protein